MEKMLKRVQHDRWVSRHSELVSESIYFFICEISIFIFLCRQENETKADCRQSAKGLGVVQDL